MEPEKKIQLKMVAVTFPAGVGSAGGLNNQFVQINNSQFQTKVCRSKTHEAQMSLMNVENEGDWEQEEMK